MSSGLPIAPATSQLLTLKAWGDFVHDFDDPVRANVTVGVLNTVPIEVTSSIKKLYGQLAEKIVEASGKNSATAFQLFRAYFGNTIPPADIPDKVLHENDITGLVGINYAGVVAMLKADEASKLGPTAATFLNGQRNYAISAVTEKIKGQHQHVVSCLNSLSGRTEVVLMWDAGACEISEVGAKFDAEAVIPGFDAAGMYNVYFINSKENLSDPAPKPTVDTLSTKNPNVNIYFLEEWDPTETTIYPAWPTTAEEFVSTQGDQNTNLYSGYRLITKRGEGKTVSGTLFTVSGKQIEIADIKETSKVANAVTTAVLDMLMGKSPEEFMSPILLKRAGDWCQALTLLDRSRRYRVVPSRGNTGEPPADTPVTLADFEKNNALIALITNDRVLLAFSIALGLNVLFTNVRNAINWMLLFQNTDAGRVDDAVEVLAKSTETYAAVDADLATLRSGDEALRQKIVAGLGGVYSNLDLTGFLSVRDAAYRLVRLPSVSDIGAAKETLFATADAIQKGNPAVPLAIGLGVLRSINSRLDAAREIAKGLLTPETAVYPDAASENATLLKLGEIWRSGAILAPTTDVYIQYQTLIDKLAADVAKFPADFKLPPLPDDSALQGPLTGILGAPPPMSRASRSMPALTPLGLLFRYYNTRLNLGPQMGGSKKLVLTGGAGLAAQFEDTFLIPSLLDSKAIVAYTEETASSADNVDETMFIAKDTNYVQNIDGSYTTVVDGFLTMAFSFGSMESLFASPAFSGYPTPVDGMIAKMTEDGALAYPLMYSLIKGLLRGLDVLYGDLLGVQSLEYSNLDALKDLADVEFKLGLLGGIVNTIYLRSPLAANDIAAFLSAYYTTWIKDVEAEPEDADDILATLVSNANSEGGQALVYQRYVQQYPAGEENGFEWYLEDVGPQLAYDSRVARATSQLLTERDVLIDVFSVPFFTEAGATLADYSRYLEDIPKLDVGDAATNAPYAAVEAAITDSFTAQSSAGVIPDLLQGATVGGFKARRSLYKKHVQPPVSGGRPGLYARLRQRTRKGATARLRQLPVVSHTRRQRKHVDRV